MSLPIMLLCTWLLLGMLTTMTAWSGMSDELEMAISTEDEEIHGALRVLMTILFVLAWPLIVAEMLKR